MSATPSGDLFRPLSGAVRTKRGLISLERGDPIPEDIEPAELDRLRDLGAIGTPPGMEAPPEALAAVDIFTSQRHYFDHVRTVAALLQAPVQVTESLHQTLGRAREGVLFSTYRRRPRRHHDTALVMGPRDVRAAVDLGWERIAYLCHGIGQDYNRLLAAAAPGENIPWDRVEVVLLPSDFAAERFRPLCPQAAKVVVGQPKLDLLRAVPRPASRTVALSFRWSHQRAPESRGAIEHYSARLERVASQARAAGIEVLGHAHPRIFTEAVPIYRRAGIEPVRDFTEVVERAAVYACDNSSTLFEFAALDRPVVVMNAPWYRREVNHGGRFWDWADVGEQVDGPDELLGALERALDDDPQAERRRAVVKEVLPLADGYASRRAADALIERFPALRPPEAADELEAAAEGAQGADPDFDVMVATSSAEEVIEAATDEATAQALLEAELAVREDQARPEVIDGLRARGAAPPGAEAGATMPV